jgi:hypothetical protein
MLAGSSNDNTVQPLGPGQRPAAMRLGSSNPLSVVFGAASLFVALPRWVAEPR